jgi:hypothetical protein
VPEAAVRRAALFSNGGEKGGVSAYRLSFLHDWRPAEFSQSGKAEKKEGFQFTVQIGAEIQCALSDSFLPGQSTAASATGNNRQSKSWNSSCQKPG